VVLRGEAAALAQWRRELDRVYAPGRMVICARADARDLPAAIAAKPARGTISAYVCRGSVCSEPLDTFAALAATLRTAPAAPAR